MVNAIVLIKAEPKKINDIAQRLVEIRAISEVYSVGGRFDLVAIIRVRENEDLSEVVTSQLLDVDGIISTETLMAFRVHSNYDLERLFEMS